LGARGGVSGSFSAPKDVDNTHVEPPHFFSSHFIFIGCTDHPIGQPISVDVSTDVDRVTQVAVVLRSIPLTSRLPNTVDCTEAARVGHGGTPLLDGCAAGICGVGTSVTPIPIPIGCVGARPITGVGHSPWFGGGFWADAAASHHTQQENKPFHLLT
jgi:hypothetical protein